MVTLAMRPAFTSSRNCEYSSGERAAWRVLNWLNTVIRTSPMTSQMTRFFSILFNDLLLLRRLPAHSTRNSTWGRRRATSTMIRSARFHSLDSTNLYQPAAISGRTIAAHGAVRRLRAHRGGTGSLVGRGCRRRGFPARSGFSLRLPAAACPDRGGGPHRGHPRAAAPLSQPADRRVAEGARGPAPGRVARGGRSRRHHLHRRG